MFPGVDGFHWTAGHIIFLGLFFAVAATILTTVASAAWRSARDIREDRAAGLCWKSDFAELPVHDRRCRHELAGRVISRTCDNAFNCGSCGKYAQFAVLPARGDSNPSGLNYPDDRLYSRDHTWVKVEPGGTVSIGLDDFAQHVLGTPDSITLPEIGSEIELNGTAWQMKKHKQKIRVRAPIEGTVIAKGTQQDDWILKIQPRRDVKDPLTTRHLLRGPEVRGWIVREMERLQLQLQPLNTAPTLADGGTLMPNLMDSLPHADWETVLADTFLEA